MAEGTESAAAALLETLAAAGITHLFANLGSDHPPLIEAFAAAAEEGRRVPRLVSVPHEMVALSAAHGYALASGQAAAVLVHVECGTQALGGAVHNAARGRVPILILAGASPATQEGELPGSRNEFIHWLQDVADQRGIVRGYVKYDHEIRRGHNIREITARALQIAQSAPKGPVYLMAAREVFAEPIPRKPLDLSRFAPLGPAALPAEAAREIAARLASASRPLVVTSHLGRNPRAVPLLQRLCGRLAVGVLESVPSAMNYPHDDPLYLGSQWNEPAQNPDLAEADAVLVLESDVPWIPLHNRPPEGAAIFHIDADPLKEDIPLWSIGATRAFRADAETALGQILAALDGLSLDEAQVAARRAHYAARHRARAARLDAEARGASDVITPAFLTARLAAALGPEWVILNEGISNYGVIHDHLRPRMPGRIWASGGSSLGWHGGAAVGVKLARPEREVAALTGDGSFLFSIPSGVHWLARRMRTPFLTVIYDNGGWKSPKLSTLALYPEGRAKRDEAFGVSSAPIPDYPALAAAAGGAWGRTVERPEALDAAIAAAIRAVREERRAALLHVRLPGL
jgi:acetolactate synthase-1/2/3 large subunit